EQHRAHHGEDRGVGSDAEGQCQHRDETEAGGAPQASESALHVLAKIRKPFSSPADPERIAADLPPFLRPAFVIAERRLGDSAGLFRTHALGLELSGFEIEVQVDLAPDIAVGAARVIGQSEDAGHETYASGLCRSGHADFTPRARCMTRANRLHRATSSL